MAAWRMHRQGAGVPPNQAAGPPSFAGGVPGLLSGGQWTPLGSKVECSLAGSLRRATHLPWFLGVVRGCSAAVAVAGRLAVAVCGLQGDRRGRETLSVAAKHPALPAGGQDSLSSSLEFNNLKYGTSHSYCTSSFPSASSLQTNRRYCTQSAPCRCVCVCVCLVPASPDSSLFLGI